MAHPRAEIAIVAAALLLGGAFVGDALAGERGTLVFSARFGGSWRLWSVAPDGSALQPLDATGSREEEHAPAVSPDGRRVVYVDAGRRLRIMNRGGSGRAGIPLPEGIYAQPSWSPAGDALAYVRYRVLPSDEGEIWMVSCAAAGWGEPRRLTQHPPMRLNPAFSPDGRRLAFAEFRRDEAMGVVEEIGLLDLGTGSARLLTSHGVDSFRPAWSPGGEEIAYVSSQGGDYDVWVLSLADGVTRRLTENAAYDGEPAWAPDASEVAFVSTRSGSREVWAVPARGGTARQLTSGGGECKDLVWVR